MKQPDIPIISVTGTKGKTTVVSVLADLLRRANFGVMHVETSGHFVNGQRRSIAADSQRIWGVRTVTALPGKYLGEFLHDPALQKKPAAVLECSFSCSSRGLGYGTHAVGVFLNVFEDHVDPSGPIKNKHDLAVAKSFIFKAIGESGYAVFNADDELVCEMLSMVPAGKNIQLIPCGIDFTHFDIQEHLNQGGAAITVEDSKIVLKRGASSSVLCSLAALPWTFGGAFEPSVRNMLHVCGALYGFFNGALPSSIRSLLEMSRLNPATGRLVVMKAQNGSTIIADYAHEKVSLKAIAALARTLLKGQGNLYGVVRLAHERSDALLRETGHVIADIFDEVIVYDKIDGYWRKPGLSPVERYPQVAGRTSEIVTAAIKERNEQVTRIVREDEAVAYVAAKATAEDVIVIILNDDIERSLGFIREAFKAEYV